MTRNIFLKYKMPCTPYNSVFCGVHFREGDLSDESWRAQQC